MVSVANQAGWGAFRAAKLELAAFCKAGVPGQLARDSPIQSRNLIRRLGTGPVLANPARAGEAVVSNLEVAKGPRPLGIPFRGRGSFQGLHRRANTSPARDGAGLQSIRFSIKPRSSKNLKANRAGFFLGPAASNASKAIVSTIIRVRTLSLPPRSRREKSWTGRDCASQIWAAIRKPAAFPPREITVCGRSVEGRYDGKDQSVSYDGRG